MQQQVMGSLHISSSLPEQQAGEEAEKKPLLPAYSSSSSSAASSSPSPSLSPSPPPYLLPSKSCSLPVPIAISAISTLIAIIALFFAFFSCKDNRVAHPRDNTDTANAERWGFSRPLINLKRPVVLLISSDGFRYGYHWKVALPAIDRLRSNGTEAVPGMISVYPTLTFPNHYSIATGLFPASHGIVSNYFTDPSMSHQDDDAKDKDKAEESFHPGVTDPKWWKYGEPIWESVTKNGLIAATYFWPGSDVSKGAWNCSLPYCHSYNSSIPYEERVETILHYFDIEDEEKRPSFLTLYFEEPDHSGHLYGPDDPHIDEAITHVDQVIGKLLEGLETRGILDDVSLIFLSDHGMVGTCDKKIIYLEDLLPWIEIKREWVDSLSPIFALRPPSSKNKDGDGNNVNEVYENITLALSSGKVPNAEYLKVYLKDELPTRLHYCGSDRIAPIIGLVSEGYKVEMKRSKAKECGGAHGYDNQALSMHPIFIAHGPQFARGRQMPSFVNTEVYNIITSILGIQGAPNNGSSSFVDTILLPFV